MAKDVPRYEMTKSFNESRPLSTSSSYSWRRGIRKITAKRSEV